MYADKLENEYGMIFKPDKETTSKCTCSHATSLEAAW